MKPSGSTGLLTCAVLIGTLHSQSFSQRGFLDTTLTTYPQTAPNDTGQAIIESLFRYEPTWTPKPWLKLNAELDARADTHDQVERSAGVDWSDRSIERPALSIRRLSAILKRDRFTAEIGKQFIRWGKADILNPTDRFAPKDFLSIVDTEVLAVTAARLTYSTGSDSFDAVWQPRFTPSRSPLLNQRWTVLPPVLGQFQLNDLGAAFPGRSSFGARWDHNGAGYEYSLSYFDGFNHLPLFTGALAPPNRIDFVRTYPALRLYGADAAVPLQWFTIKTEEAWFTSPKHDEDE